MAKELERGTWYSQITGSCTTKWPKSRNATHDIAKEQEHRTLFCQRAGTWNILLPKGWNVEHFIAKGLDAHHVKIHNNKQFIDFMIYVFRWFCEYDWHNYWCEGSLMKLCTYTTFAYTYIVIYPTVHLLIHTMAYCTWHSVSDIQSH
mgnify:CR=1 FL=1